VVRLRPAPQFEVDRARTAMLGQLDALGSDIDLVMTPLGDRVHHADIGSPRPPRKAPTTTRAVQERAHAVLIDHAAAFGLTAEEVMHATLEVERVRDIPGIAWEVIADIARDGKGPMPVRLGRGYAVVTLDRRGGVIGIDVDATLLPPVTVCTDTLPGDRIERAVIGRTLEYDSGGSDAHAGTVGPGDLRGSAYRVMIVRGSGEDADVTVGGVMAVRIEHDYAPWQLLIDPSAGVVIETIPIYDDELE
jgi:hypothetical protein